MAFDDRKPEPLVAVACLSAVCGLLAPALGWSFGWWAAALALTPPAAVWAVLEVVWRRERRE